MSKTYFVYIMASGRHGTLYVGVTSDLARRYEEHRQKCFSGFTAKYGVTRLVYFAETGDVWSAIQREKTIKKWPRQWKINVIEKENPRWDDLGERLAYGLSEQVRQ